MHLGPPVALAASVRRRWFCCFYLLFNVFLIVSGDSVFVFVLLYITLYPFYFCNRLEEDKIAGSFAFVVLPMSC